MKLDGCLMSKDTVVANINDGRISVVNEQLIPLYLKNRSFESWLEGRAIDTHRINSRLLKKALRLTTANDMDVVLKVNAATITDTYWFKPEGSELTYDDIRFKENMFDKLALYGDPDSFNKEYSRTPELTNTGSFEKCWRIDGNGEWWIYKQGDYKELFSELFICELGKVLGFNMAHYEKDGKYIKSLDFTEGALVNFESAAGIVGEDEDYAINFEALRKLSENCVDDYVRMIYLDTICFNMDRHTKNYGVLRDVESGAVIGLAPNFDNNIALIARDYPENILRDNDKLIQFFVEFLESCPDALECLEKLNIPTIDREMIESCMDKIPIDVDRAIICEFVLNGQTQVTAAVEQLRQDNGFNHTMS